MGHLFNIKTKNFQFTYVVKKMCGTIKVRMSNLLEKEIRATRHRHCADNKSE